MSSIVGIPKKKNKYDKKVFFFFMKRKRVAKKNCTSQNMEKENPFKERMGKVLI